MRSNTCIGEPLEYANIHRCTCHYQLLFPNFCLQFAEKNRFVHCTFLHSQIVGKDYLKIACHTFLHQQKPGKKHRILVLNVAERYEVPEKDA